MTITISDAYLAKHLKEVLAQVQEHGARFKIHRKGQLLAEIGPPTAPAGITMREFVELMRDVPMPNEGFADDLEAIRAEQGTEEIPEWPC